MAFSVNRITLLGNVAREPELRYTPQGTAVCSFSMATNRSIKDESQQSGWRDIATFHRVVVWGKQGERVSTLPKGAKVYVEGRIDNRSYDQNGTKKYISEVIADQVIDLSGKKQTVKAQEEAPVGQEQEPDNTEPVEGEEEVDPNDIPF